METIGCRKDFFRQILTGMARPGALYHSSRSCQGLIATVRGLTGSLSWMSSSVRLPTMRTMPTCCIWPHFVARSFACLSRADTALNVARKGNIEVDSHRSAEGAGSTLIWSDPELLRGAASPRESPKLLNLGMFAPTAVFFSSPPAPLDITPEYIR